MITVRFGYRPANPGWKSKWYDHVKTYIGIDNAIENYDGHSEIYIKFGNQNYRKITYDQLINFKR